MNTLLLGKIRAALAAAPVDRAWLFGSYARSENSPKSDIDIMVRFLPNAQISLLDYGGIICKLEECAGCRIDLMEEGTLLPFAQQTAERDKVLIYERHSS